MKLLTYGIDIHEIGIECHEGTDSYQADVDKVKPTHILSGIEDNFAMITLATVCSNKGIHFTQLHSNLDVRLQEMWSEKGLFLRKGALFTVEGLLATRKISHVPQSYTYMPFFYPVICKLLQNRTCGMIDLVHPGTVSELGMCQLYRSIVDPKYTWTSYSIEEQRDALKQFENAPHTPDRLLEVYPDVPSIKGMVTHALREYKDKHISTFNLKGDEYTLMNLQYDHYDTNYLWLLFQLTVLEPDKMDKVRFCDFVDNLSAEHMVRVVKCDTKIVGTYTVLKESKLIHNYGKVAHIEDVVVDCSMRGTGLGKVMMQQAIRECDDCYKVILDCSEENVPFYEKTEFRRKGVQMALYNC